MQSLANALGIDQTDNDARSGAARLLAVLALVVVGVFAWRAARDFLTALLVVGAVLIAAWMDDAGATAPDEADVSAPASAVRQCTLSR